MPEYTELLPASKSSKHSGIRWTPAEGDYNPVAGTLVIDTDRARVEYLVTEFVPGWDGRAFVLEKIGAGTDKEAENYACFVARNGQDRSCECKGFLRTGGCKHLASLAALLANGWL